MAPFPCSSACDTLLTKSMKDKAGSSLLDMISYSETLRKKFSEAIRQPVKSQKNVEHSETESGNACDRETDPLSDNNNEWFGSQMVADEHQPEHSLLGTDVSQQSRGVSRLVADEHQLMANPLVTGDHQGSASTSEDLSQRKLQMFDPSSLSSSDDFTFGGSPGNYTVPQIHFA